MSNHQGHTHVASACLLKTAEITKTRVFSSSRWVWTCKLWATSWGRTQLFCITKWWDIWAIFGKKRLDIGEGRQRRRKCREPCDQGWSCTWGRKIVMEILMFFCCCGMCNINNVRCLPGGICDMSCVAHRWFSAVKSLSWKSMRGKNVLNCVSRTDTATETKVRGKDTSDVFVTWVKIKGKWVTELPPETHKTVNGDWFVTFCFFFSRYIPPHF